MSESTVSTGAGDPIRVAVLGLGDMGRALATRAQHTGHPVVVWNRTQGKSGDLRESPTAADAVAASDAILLVVHDADAVGDVLTPQVLEAFSPTAHLLVVSNVAPSLVQNLNARLPDRVIDTPIIGSPSMVTARQAEFFVGGSVDAVRAVAPLLDHLSVRYTHCGPVGAGLVMKILANAQLAVGVGALAEAVALARRYGIHDRVLATIFGDSNSIMISPTVASELDAILDPKHDGKLGPVADAIRDMKLALDLAPEIRLKLYPATLDLLDRVSGQNWPDYSAVVEGLT